MRIRTSIGFIIAIIVLLVLTYKYGQDRSLIDFKDSFIEFLPKLLTALLILVLAQVVIQLSKIVLTRILGRFESSYAIVQLLSLFLNIIAVLAALSVLVGRVSSFVTSLGLIGLGITWALQTPIVCFTGWILINIKRYYRVGDRIKVNEIYGDVSQIDFLNTTVWEYGSTWFTAEQPSGRLITIPNSVVLQGAVINYTRDFEFVWDEITVSMSYESDLAFTKETVMSVARRILGDSMAFPIKQYREILAKSHIDYRISEEPEIFLTFEDSWMNIYLRYLVGARDRRAVKTEILEAIFYEFGKPENIDRIKPVYPRSQIQRIDGSGMPVDVSKSGE